MNTISAASAAVTGARHLRVPRNGQDAAATWVGDGCGAIIVCDGCSAGAYSEVGARLASQFVIAHLEQLLPTERPDEALWSVIRADLGAELGRLVEAMPGDGVAVLHDHFLFTIVAAAWRGNEVAVWALGDGAYALGDRVCTLGPFEDNMPPYLAYDLLRTQHPAHFVLTDASCGSVMVATDGIADIGFDAFLDLDRYFANPDALRRQLVTRARSSELVDWDERRIVRTPALLQDDGAIAVLRWS
jgi:hypothetical protein